MGAKVRALVGGRDRLAQAGPGTAVSVVLDRTPFYAESGGQVGDTGVIETSGGARVRIDDTQYGLPGLVLHRGVVDDGHHRRGRRGGRPDRRCPPRRHPPQPHRHPHPALGAARGAGPAREAGGFVRRSRPPALRLQPPRGAHPRPARPHRGAGERRDHRRRAGASLRDHQGARGVTRRDRVLRRQVRRPRARARGGGALDRAVRRHPRARARVHRPGQDRERGFDRRQPAAHRGGHRRGCARRASTTKRCSCAGWPTRCG